MPTHRHADTEICRSFHLPRTLNARLVDVAASLGVSVAELLRRAIVAMLDRIDREREGTEAPPMAAEPEAAYHAQLRKVAANRGGKAGCKRKRY